MRCLHIHNKHSNSDEEETGHILVNPPNATSRTPLGKARIFMLPSVCGLSPLIILLGILLKYQTVFFLYKYYKLRLLDLI